jgi:hypothetical protein
VDAVELVDELDVIPAGFSLSPDALLNDLTGSFMGHLQTPSSAVSGRLAVEDLVGEVRAIYQSWDGEGPPSENCVNLYEFAMTATLRTGDDSLDELFSLLLRSSASGRVDFSLSIPAVEVGGTLRPSGLDATTSTLRISGQYDLGVWGGDLVWLDDLTEQPDPGAEYAGSFTFFP